MAEEMEGKHFEEMQKDIFEEIVSLLEKAVRELGQIREALHDRSQGEADIDSAIDSAIAAAAGGEEGAEGAKEQRRFSSRRHRR